MEVESFQQQALSVRMPCDNFDPSMEPTDGEEFLTKMIYERSHCPSVVVKPVRFKKAQQAIVGESHSYPLNDVLDTSERALRPTIEWKEVQLNDFVKLRNKISNFRQKLEINGFTSQELIPLTDDEDEWKRFCQENDPLLSTMLRIDQRSLEDLVEFLSNWLQQPGDSFGAAPIQLSGKDNWLGNWIYSVLACLHLPLEPSVHSVLRYIAKSCVLLRNELSSTDVNGAAPLNLFIFLIAKYFDQLDLADFV